MNWDFPNLAILSACPDSISADVVRIQELVPQWLQARKMFLTDLAFLCLAQEADQILSPCTQLQVAASQLRHRVWFVLRCLALELLVSFPVIEDYLSSSEEKLICASAGFVLPCMTNERTKAVATKVCLKVVMRVPGNLQSSRTNLARSLESKVHLPL